MLADETDALVKGAWLVVVLVIWGITAAVKAARNATEEGKRRQIRQPLATPARAMPPLPPVAQRASGARLPLPPPRALPPRRGAPPVPPVRSNAQFFSQAQQAFTAPRPAPVLPPVRRKGGKPARPVLPAPSPAAAPPERTDLRPAPEAPPAAKPAAKGVGAAVLSRWLRPEVLRRQFILTEILQPPLALRAPRQDHP